MQRRERHLAGADEEQLVRRRRRTPGAVGREEPGLLHRVLAHQHRRDDRREPLADQLARHPLHERELEQHRLAHQVREAGAAHLGTACSLSTQPIASPNAAWSSGGGAGVSPTTRTHLAVVLAAVGHRRVGRVRHLQRAARARRRRRRRAPLPAPASSSFSAPAAAIFAGRSSGGGLADLLRRRVLPRAQLLDRAERVAPGGVGREHVVDQARRDPLALDAGAVLRLVAQPA